MNDYEVTITVAVSADSVDEAKAAAREYLLCFDDIRDSEVKLIDHSLNDNVQGREEMP